MCMVATAIAENLGHFSFLTSLACCKLSVNNAYKINLTTSQSILFCMRVPLLCKMSYQSSSAFSRTRVLPELRWVLSCESPAVFLHTPLQEKEPWGPFYQLQRVLAKGRPTSNLTECTGNENTARHVCFRSLLYQAIVLAN